MSRQLLPGRQNPSIRSGTVQTQNYVEPKHDRPLRMSDTSSLLFYLTLIFFLFEVGLLKLFWCSIKLV